jgi:hypothetical protein
MQKRKKPDKKEKVLFCLETPRVIETRVKT